MSSEVIETQKITMSFLYKRNNRNKHFQIIKENRWIQTGRVFTGLGLYKEINECAMLTKHTQLENWRTATIEETLDMIHKIHDEILPCVRLGKDTSIAEKIFGEVKVKAGWEYET